MPQGRVHERSKMTSGVVPAFLSPLRKKFTACCIVLLLGVAACTGGPAVSSLPTSTATGSVAATPESVAASSIQSLVATVNAGGFSPPTVTPLPAPLLTPSPPAQPTSTLSPIPTLPPPPVPTPTNTPNLLPPPDLQISDQDDTIQYRCERGEESKRVRLTWSTGYDVNLPYGTRIEYNGEAMNPPFVDITVPCGSHFKWEVKAENGSSSRTLTFALLFSDTTPPLAPRVRAPSDGDRKICNNQDAPLTFQWDLSQDSASNDGHVVSGVAGYEVSLQVSQDGGQSWQDRERSGQLSGNQWQTSVPCGYRYRWMVRAIDGAGNQSEGYWRTLSTGPDQTPPPPPALRQPTGPVKCEPVERQQVSLAWTSVSDESNIRGYEVVIQQRYGTNPWTVVANQFVTNTYYTVNVLCNYEYQWYVIAEDGQENRSSPPSNWYRFAVVPPAER